MTNGPVWRVLIWSRSGGEKGRQMCETWEEVLRYLDTMKDSQGLASIRIEKVR